MKRARRSTAVLILTLCLALILPAAVAAQGRRTADSGIWSTVVAGLDAAAEVVRSFWSGLLWPQPPPPPVNPNGDNGACLDPEGRPMPCKPDL